MLVDRSITHSLFFFLLPFDNTVHWATVILDRATLIYTIIMQVHRMQHTRHHNIPQQIQIVAHRTLILSQLAAMQAAVVATTVTVRTIVPALTNHHHHHHHTVSAIMCCVNPDLTMAAATIR